MMRHFAYLRSYYVQYRVKIIDVTYADITFQKFGIVIRTKEPILEYEHGNGVKGRASLRLLNEVPWPDLRLAAESWDPSA